MNTFTFPGQNATIMLPSGAGRAQGNRAPDAPGPLDRLGNVFRRRWQLLVGCTLLAALLAGITGLLLPPAYTARAQLLIAPPAASANGAAVARTEEIAMTVETEVSAVNSRDQINRVLDRLMTMPAFAIASFGREGRLGRAARWMAAEVERRLGPAWIEAILPSGQAAALHALAEPPTPQRRREQILDEIERDLKIGSEPRARVISVRYTAPSAELAALVANTVTEAYVEQQQERKREGIRYDLARLDRQLPVLLQEMETANAAIRAYRLDHAVLDTANTEQQEQQAIVLKSKITATEAGLAATDAERAALADLRTGPRNDIVEARSSTLLATLQEQERRLLAARAGGGRADAAPEETLSQVRRQIVAEIDLADARLSDESAMLVERARAFRRQFDALQAGLRDIQPATDQLRQLQRLADAKRQIYEDDLRLQQKLLQNQHSVVPDAAILSAAAPPQKPASANPILFLPPALVIGLLAGGFGALWREARDTTLRDERTVYGILGITCSGFLLPAAGWRRRHPPASSLEAAALRGVFVATLNPETTRHGRKVVLVTSSVSGEDSLWLAESFSLCAARLLPRVLLIKLNVRASPARARLAALRARLRRPAKTDTVSPVPGMTLSSPKAGLPLDVLSLDSRKRDPLAFLIQGDLPQSLERLRETYDCIVIHAGPILETIETQLLIEKVDRTLLAVRWGHTHRHVVENALTLLGRFEEPSRRPGSVSAVLTRVNVRAHLAYRFGDAIEAMARAYHRRSFA